MPLALERITEGTTVLDVPAQSLVKREPDTFPVFFNPAAKTNRDLSVALVRAVGGRTFCDSMSGLGSRGIRIANEGSGRMEVFLNDFNQTAIGLARENAGLNNVLERAVFSEEEANSFLFSRSGREEKFDHIDIDPFGTPAYHVQAGFSASRDGTIVSVTATDTPVLCGVHPRVSLRRYGSTSTRNVFKHETGIRILLNYCARMAAVQDIGIEPILVHNTRHYLRVYVRARHGAARADESLERTGYVSSCRACGKTLASDGSLARCLGCGSPTVSAGPVWTGALTDQKVVVASARVSSDMGFREAEQILLSLVGVDAFPPYGYDLEEVCSRLKMASVSREKVVYSLKRSGYSCMRQPLENSGIKTEAEYDDVVRAVRSVAAMAMTSKGIS